MRNKEFNKFIGKELMLLRKDRGLTNEELSNISGVATSTISRYENGDGAINLDTFNKLIINLNSDIYIFFKNIFAKMQNEN